MRAPDLEIAPSASTLRVVLDRGRVRAGKIERAVTFAGPSDVDPGTADQAYRAKYGRPSCVGAITTSAAAGTTPRPVPRRHHQEER